MLTLNSLAAWCHDEFEQYVHDLHSSHLLGTFRSASGGRLSASCFSGGWRPFLSSTHGALRVCGGHHTCALTSDDRRAARERPAHRPAPLHGAGGRAVSAVLGFDCASGLRRCVLSCGCDLWLCALCRFRVCRFWICIYVVYRACFVFAACGCERAVCYFIYSETKRNSPSLCPIRHAHGPTPAASLHLHPSSYSSQ